MDPFLLSKHSYCMQKLLRVLKRVILNSECFLQNSCTIFFAFLHTLNLVHWSKWSVSNASSQIYLRAFLDLVFLTTFTILSICFSKNSLNLASSSCESNVIRRIWFSFSSFLWFSRSRVSESSFSHSSLNFLKSTSMSIEDIPFPNALAGLMASLLLFLWLLPNYK